MPPHLCSFQCPSCGTTLAVYPDRHVQADNNGAATEFALGRLEKELRAARVRRAALRRGYGRLGSAAMLLVGFVFWLGAIALVPRCGGLGVALVALVGGGCLYLERRLETPIPGG